MLLGNEANDFETHADAQVLKDYQKFIQSKGFETSIELGFGNPKKSIPKKVRQFEADLLVMGAHGHDLLKDLIFGTTVDVVRHRVKIPVFIVRV